MFHLATSVLPFPVPHISLITDATAHVLIMQEQEVHDRPYFRYQRMQIRLGHEAQGCNVMQCDGLLALSRLLSRLHGLPRLYQGCMVCQGSVKAAWFAKALPRLHGLPRFYQGCLVCQRDKAV